MSEIEDSVKETVEAHAPESHLNSAIAALVAMTATLMAIGNIKDGNIVQAMTQAQAKSVDTWSYYQAKSTKQHLAEASAEQLRAQIELTTAASAEARAAVEKRIAAWEGQAKRYESEKETIKKEAEGYEKEYERLNIHDDQFDMAEAFFTIGMALFGIAALTKKRWLFFFALVTAAFGAILEAAGFLGWLFHPEWLAKLLG